MSIPKIDIRPDHWQMVKDILSKHVPQHEVWAFGSRAKWTAKQYSDLDIAILTEEPLPLSVSAALSDDFSESDLPWKVDVVDWATTSESFREIIQRDKVVVQKKEGRAVEWRVVTIGELIAMDGGNIKTGPLGTVLKESEYTSAGVPLISVGEIGYGTFHVRESTPRVSTEITNRLPEYILQEGDIVFGRKGAVDRSARISSTQAGWFLGSDGIRLRLPSTTDSRFMAFQLQSSESRSWILQHATGTTMASLNQDVISRIPVLLPSLPEQKRIAHILGTLDDRIDNLRQTNATLEAIARALFQDWFVDFGPVRAKMEGRAPYLPAELWQLFPERLVDPELGEIPEGWIIATFDTISNVSSGKRPAERSDTLSPTCYIPLYGGGGAMGYVPSPLYEKPILFTGRVGTLGLIFRTAKPSWPSDNTLVIEPRDGIFDFVYFVLKGFDLTTLNRGSTQPLLTQTDLKNQRFVLPSGDIVKAYQEFSVPIFQKIADNENQSQTLSTLRDTLLPKLVSGELRINNVEQFSEVAP